MSKNDKTEKNDWQTEQENKCFHDIHLNFNTSEKKQTNPPSPTSGQRQNLAAVFHLKV